MRPARVELPQAEAAANQAAISSAMGQWVGLYEWDHVLHLTTGKRQVRREASGNRAPTAQPANWMAARTMRLKSVSAPQLAVPQLTHAFLGFVRYLTKVAQGPVPYFYVIEGGVLGDHPHIHALVAGTGNLDTDRIANAWRHAAPERCLVSTYDRRRGAAHYISKEIASRALAWDFSKRMKLRGREVA